MLVPCLCFHWMSETENIICPIRYSQSGKKQDTTTTAEWFIDQVSCFRVCSINVPVIIRIKHVFILIRIHIFSLNKNKDCTILPAVFALYETNHLPCFEFVFVDHYLSHLSGWLSVIHMLLASLISHIITHTVIKRLTTTHANIVCSDLHLRCRYWSMLYCVCTFVSCITVVAQRFPHILSHITCISLIKHKPQKREEKCLFCCTPYPPFPCIEYCVDRQLESLKASADMLLLWVRNRQTGVSLHSPPYLLSALPPCFFFFFFYCPLSFCLLIKCLTILRIID